MSDMIYPPKPKNRRLEPSVYREIGRPCFITVRCAPDTQPFTNPARASHAVQLLLALQEAYECRVEVYCLMPDHLHVMVSPVTGDISTIDFIDRFKSRCRVELMRMGRQGPLWQRRSYDHVIRRYESLERIVAYILTNPVRKGLCATPEEYPWSGIPGKV